MTGQLRKFALTAHVACSVGWLGAVAASLALAVAGVTSQDVEVVRAAYLTMEVIGWSVLVPFSVASLLTGLVQALGSRWGLVRHYWVLVKLLLNLVAIAVLLLYMQTLTVLADAATQTRSTGDLSGLQNPSPVAHAGAALLLLLVATTLSVYKPQGLTRYGQRDQRARSTQRDQPAAQQH